MDLIIFFKTGGFFMYPIVMVIALGLAISIERYFYLTKTTRITDKTWKQINPMLKANDFARAQHSIVNSTTPLARVLNYGFARYKPNAKRERIEAAMEEGVMEVTPEIEARTHYLATLANVATLLGLFGTVSGLIEAFGAVANADPAAKAELLSASISIAMNATALGLGAAIPLLLIHSFLATKTSKLIDSIEMAAVKCSNLMVEE
ncbi:MAG: MotA/TolQ/ExbB proton channel family protein [Pseudomonadota bacterium]